MSSSNGRSPTSQTVDGIVIDGNRITRREYVRIVEEIAMAADANQLTEMEELTGELVEQVVIDWPFDGLAISKDNYLDLPMMDAQAVSRALDKVFSSLGGEKKASGRRSSSRAGKRSR